LNPLKRRRDLFIIQGDPDAPLGLISWGSVAGVAMEALEQALAEGLHVKLLIPKLLYPVAEEVYQDFFASVRRGLVVEQSHQGQLYRLIRMYVDVPPGLEYLAKSGSNPILTREVVARVRQMVMAIQRKQKLEPEPQLG
jgi:2-oxoglutarate ferredoxin oxidoreductase subunit alpha